jgi:hypothetical protein
MNPEGSSLPLGNSLDTLFLLRPARSRRVSSYARDGSNHDWTDIDGGETATLVDVGGAGIVRHIWCTVGSEDDLVLRKAVLRMYWDGEANPSVEAPLGDFFGLGLGLRRNFFSAPLSMAPSEGRAMVCYFPMPFSRGARMTIENQSELPLMFYFYFDYEEFEGDMTSFGRFHAQYRQETPAVGWAEANKEMWKDKSAQAGSSRPSWWPKNWDSENRTGADNYVILEAAGEGHYVGCNLSVQNTEEQANDWYGEGDDMIFVDGEQWPPELHGTGTEDYFNTAFGPKEEFSSPFFGITRYSGDDVGRPWGGKNTMYRFHVHDPIRFRSSIRVTIEHGHDNMLTNHYSSTAYWYQREPHATFPPLPAAEERLPPTDET